MSFEHLGLKTLTAKQLTQIIMQVVFDQTVIDERETYQRFVEDLGRLVTQYCGGDVVGTVTTATKSVAVRIACNDSVPDDGGIYQNFDTDVSWIRDTDVSLNEVTL